MPSSGRSAASAIDTSSSSDCSSASGSRAPPTNARISTRSVRRPVRPLRRQPRGGEDAGALGARHDESRSVQRMGDGGSRGRRARRCPWTRRGSPRRAARGRCRRRARDRRPRTPASVTMSARPAIGSPSPVSDARRIERRCRRTAVFELDRRPAAARDQRADQLAQAAGQRSKRAVRRRVGGTIAAERAQQAAVLALGLDEAGKQRADRQPIDVAGMDAGEQRLGQVRRRFVAEAPAHERRRSTRRRPSLSRRDEQLRAHAQSCRPR